MTVPSSRSRRRVSTLLMACVMVATLAACGQSPTVNAAETPNVDAASASNAQAAVFIPSDSITISQHTPLNKWTAFAPRLVSALRKAGLAKDAIVQKTSPSQAKQNDDLEDYVEHHLVGEAAARRTTLFVAPAQAQSQSATVRQYGDYVSNAQSTLPTASSSGEGSTTQQEPSQADTATKRQHEEQRLAQTLGKAHKAGAHVTLIASQVADFTPDAYVSLSTPEEIGALQASQLVSKLALDNTTANHPKAIEVLLPADAGDQKSASDDAKSSDKSSDKSSSAQSQDASKSSSAASDSFNKAAFSGIWSVLAPYFQSGRAYSPSGLITASSTNDDWKSLTFEARKSSQIREALRSRLQSGSTGDRASSPAHIDGIIATNDLTSDAVTAELQSLKYHGSSADINPDITIPNIVGSITGKRTLTKQAVPKPQDAGVAGAPADGEAGDAKGTNGNTTAPSTQPNESGDLTWPIVTGYGSSISIIPNIVDGKQWATGMEDITGITSDMAALALAFSDRTPLDQVPSTSMQQVGQSTVPVLHRGLVAVSAGNLKHELIDPGYITMADAGL